MDLGKTIKIDDDDDDDDGDDDDDENPYQITLRWMISMPNAYHHSQRC